MKYVYSFKEGNKDMRELLGGKGANLAEMTNIGLPVPKGFTVTTEACNSYYKNNETIEENIINEIMINIESLEQLTNKKFGDPTNPLLVSVRSGSRVSMPGMMDTILIWESGLRMLAAMVELKLKTTKISQVVRASSQLSRCGEGLQVAT